MAQSWPGHDASAYETPMTRLGRKGLNVVDAVDDLDLQELLRLTNLVSRFGSALEVRAGQTALATTTGVEQVHSISRLNDPAASSYTRLAGSTTKIYRGQSGALTLIDSGYSGDPLAFAHSTAPSTGVPYVLIGDRSRNRKVSRTGASEIIGVPAQTHACFAEVAAENTTSICRFDSVDSTQAASWTLTAGTDTAGTGSGAPTAADGGGGAAVVDFTMVPGGAGAGLSYFSILSIAKVIDLSTLQAGTYVATDDDLMNLRFIISRPDLLEEIRVYFVCTPAFTTGVIPGTSATAQNADAFWKSFKPSDFSKYLDLSGQPASESISTLGDNIRSKRLREEFKAERDTEDTRLTQVNRRASTELYRTEVTELIAGRGRETVTGVVGFPLRRGDFARMGSDNTRSWGNITGLVIVVRTNTNLGLVVTLDDWRMTGGGGPDTTPVGYQPYDFRCIDVNPATGVKGNPSPVMAEVAAPPSASGWVDALRQPLKVRPARGSNVATTWRQKFYRRGGSPTTSDNWYYDGQNSSDGGEYQTYRTDAELQVEETLAIDNYQPVPSTNSSGDSALSTLVPIFFPVGDYMFALGDTNQPQRLYRSKRANHDAWPATGQGYNDVCPASDTLQSGCEWGGGGYVFSKARLYAILTDAEGNWTTEPTPCAEGLAGRWAMCWTPYGIAFLSPFGVKLTQGGIPEDLSSALIGPLFRNQTVHGLNPVDMAVETALKLAYHDHEIWFTYADCNGTRRHLIYNFYDKAWRSYLFGKVTSVVYSEGLQGTAQSLLLGSYALGAVYTHSGTSDDGTAIAYTARTGCVDYGDPAVEKLLSQIVVDAEIYTSTLTVQAFLNDEATAVTAQTVVGTAGLKRYVFEPFGTDPQRARNVNVELRGNAPTDNRPYFNLLGVSRKLQPMITLNEPTPWEELPGGEGYLWGCLITCDTGNVARSIEVEYTTSTGAVTSAATLSITANGRRKLAFTWTAVLAQQVRLRPTGSGVEWLRYKLEWLTDPEPPRVAGWNSNWEAFGTYTDKWLKGVLIEADTFNVAKTVVMDIDQSLAVVAVGSLTFNGRGIQQIAFAKQRGKLFRLRATDANLGKLFRWHPIFDEEPLALTRWESQETAHGRHGWQKPIEAWVTLRSSAQVDLQLISYGEDGTALYTKTYSVASTAGAKLKRRVSFEATKGVLFNYLFTSASAFWLYREESHLLVEDWASGQTFDALLPPASDDLMTPPRSVGLSGPAPSANAGLS